MKTTLLATLLAAVTAAAGVAQTPVPRDSTAPAPRDSTAPAVALAPTGAGPSRIPLDQIVAIVGDQPILRSNVLEVMNQRRAQGAPMPQDSAGFMAMASEIVNILVDEEVLLQKAKEAKIEVSDQDVAQTVDQQLKSARGRFKSEVEYREALKQAGFGTPEEYRRSYVEQAKRQAMQQRLIQQMRQEGKVLPVSVSEADVSAAFEKSKAQLPKRPATVTFRQIVIKPRPSEAAKQRAFAKAESLLVEVRNGGNFEQIAKRESMDEGTKETGGDLGWNRRGGMVPEFDRVMFALQPGQVSPVIETTYGYHVIRVDRVQPAEVKARHILISPVIDSADVRRARAEADSVAAQWKAGASFDSLVAKHHDPDEDKLLTDPFPRDSLPSSYQTAFAGKSEGSITDPFEIPSRRPGIPKLVVAQLTGVKEGGDYTVADLRTVIRDQLTEERSLRRFLDSLRRDVYVSLRLKELALGT